jgi:thioester reductase-like protein
MSTQIEEMAVELKGYGIKKFELDKAVEDLQLKNHATLVRHHTEKWRNQQLETLVQSFQQELNTVYKSIHDKEMLKKECTRVYHAFKDVNERPPEWAPKETLADSTGENNTNARIKPYVNQSEVAKERKQLESSLQILKNDDLKLKKKFKSEAKKMMSEGMVLNQYVSLM